MLPEIKSLVQLTEYTKSLTKLSDYVTLLKEDFGVSVSADNARHDNEYLYKYMVEGRYQGVSDVDLFEYARGKKDELFKLLPHLTWSLEMLSGNNEVILDTTVEVVTEVEVEKVEVKKGAGRPRKLPKYAEGVIFFSKERNEWHTFIGNQRHARPTAEKATKFLLKRGMPASSIKVISA